MPVGRQSSFVSVLRHALSSARPDLATVVPDEPYVPSFSARDLQRIKLYDAFHSNLTKRLSSLLPTDDSAFITMASLKQFLNALLATQSDLKLLMPVHRNTLPHAQEKVMEDFLEKTVHLLDACWDIKQKILGVETLHGTLQAVLSSSPLKNEPLRTPQLIRTQKAMAGLLDKELNGIEEPQERLCKSFQFGRRETGSDVSGDPPQRSRSLGGSIRSSMHFKAPQASKLLHTMSASLVTPRITTGNEEDDLCAAVYAVHVVSLFFLGILTATFPPQDKTSVPIILIQGPFSWAACLSQLQIRIQEEMKRAGVWEFDQMKTIEHRLSELLHDEEDCAEKAKEITNLLKQLKQYVDELERDLTHIYSQVMDLHNRIVSSRMEVLGMLSMCRA